MYNNTKKEAKWLRIIRNWLQMGLILNESVKAEKVSDYATSALRRHENGAFRKHFSNQKKKLEMPGLCCSVDEKTF